MAVMKCRTDLTTRSTTLLCKGLGPVRRLAHCADGRTLWAASEGAGLTSWPGPASAHAAYARGATAGAGDAPSPKRPQRQSPYVQSAPGASASAGVAVVQNSLPSPFYISFAFAHQRVSQTCVCLATWQHVQADLRQAITSIYILDRACLLKYASEHAAWNCHSQGLQ